MTFNDINDPRLRTYNRCVMFYNIMEDNGKAAAQEYIHQFSIKDRVEMIDMIKEVKDKGVDVVKAKIIRELVLPVEEPVND